MQMISLPGYAPVSRFDKHALERLVARYARVHESHVSPLVGCYRCLLNEPREARELRLAA